MVSKPLVVIVGMGEVGRPLGRILGRKFECISVDLAQADIHDPCDVMHICYPYQIHDFVGTTVRYIRQYKPKLTIINSTVVPGTTGKISAAVNAVHLAYSPVRGKHISMEKDMLRYKKFVAGCDQAATEEAIRHFKEAGFKTAVFPSPEVAELSKLLETTYLGILVAWAQEVERIGAQFGATFEDVNQFVKEVDFLPSHVFPGVIGGHCVMPNIAILKSFVEPEFLDLILKSNQHKKARASSSATVNG